MAIKRKHQRLIFLLACGAMLAIGVGLVLHQFSSSLVFFVTPSEIPTRNITPGARVRVGGLVEMGSVQRNGNQVHFRITDNKAEITVDYCGFIPALFREGQGVVAEGILETPAHMKADQLLAKHDERYMPKDVAEKLKKEGHWHEDRRAP